MTQISGASTTAIKTIETRIQALGKQQSKDGWVLTLDHMWPQSKFPTILYGSDWDLLAGFAVGDYVVIVVERGNLKPNRTPDHEYNFYWNLKSISRFPPTASSTTVFATNALEEPPLPASTRIMPSDPTRQSIERQKAVAEAREACQFLIGLYFTATLEHQGLPSEQKTTRWVDFRDTWAPIVEELTSRFAARFYKGIHGSMEEPEPKSIK